MRRPKLDGFRSEIGNGLVTEERSGSDFDSSTCGLGLLLYSIDGGKRRIGEIGLDRRNFFPDDFESSLCLGPQSDHDLRVFLQLFLYSVDFGLLLRRPTSKFAQVLFGWKVRERGLRHETGERCLNCRAFVIPFRQAGVDHCVDSVQAFSEAFVEDPAREAELVHEIQLVGQELDPSFLVDIDASSRGVEYRNSRKVGERILVSLPSQLLLGLVVVPDAEGNSYFRAMCSRAVIDVAAKINRAQRLAELPCDTAVATRAIAESW